MWLRYVFRLALGLAILIVPAISARAQLPRSKEVLISKYNPFRAINTSHPLTVTELGKWIDCLGEEMRDDGLVVVKQPDVFSQARLTRYRLEFDNELQKDISKFSEVLSARISRIDSATTTSQTALSAALAAPGTTNLAKTPELPQVSPSSSLIDLSKGAFGSVTTSDKLGLDPTVFLDEKKRYLDHLNQIRRLNIGPDMNDSLGYGLYLVRMPVSITPGEKTYHGFGADVTVSVEHEFAPDFLPSAYRNLLINDLVDVLSPVVYEMIRSGLTDMINCLDPFLTNNDQALFTVAEAFAKQIDGMIRQARQRSNWDNYDVILKTEINMNELIKNIKNQIIITRSMKTISIQIFDEEGRQVVSKVLDNDENLRRIVGNNVSDRIAPGRPDGDVKGSEKEQVLRAVKSLVPPPGTDEVQDLLPVEPVRDYILRETAQTKKTCELNQRVEREIVASRLMALYRAVLRVKSVSSENDNIFNQEFLKNINAYINGAPVDDQLRGYVRIALQTIYMSVAFGNRPIGGTIPDSGHPHPEVVAEFIKDIHRLGELDDVNLLDSTLSSFVPGFDWLGVGKALDKLNTLNLPSTRNPKQIYPIPPNEILKVFLEENVIRIAQETAKAMSTKTPRANDIRNYLRQSLVAAFEVMSTTRRTLDPTAVPPLARPDVIDPITDTIKRRGFGRPFHDSPLKVNYRVLVRELQRSRQNVGESSMAAALCWAIAVDAGLLDDALRVDMKRVFAAHGKPCDSLEALRFYIPEGFPNDAARAAVIDYIKDRWPVVTFALDPVTDQQNIADSFALQRDLQLALAFAFSTGQIGFNQMNTFRRQIQQAADTIALNRTVTGFTHGNDIFGFRFTPRFQNPPQQKTNFGVIASQLISGGPGPDYQIKKSKLEPGVREINVVLLLPNFLPTIRMNMTSNWFRLNDPEHLVFHTNRMLERGRKVQELRQAVVDACSAHQYRGDDLRNLDSKLSQLEAMLPMQSRVVQLPFENTTSGFELFSEGVSALVPELSGFEGVDVVQQGTAADIFIFGKYFNVQDTRVIVGGQVIDSGKVLGVPNAGVNTVDILSREVIHIQIPPGATPTLLKDDKVYLEIHVATPNGISNRLLVPFVPTAAAVTPAAKTAFDLNAKTKALTVKYQWFKSPNPAGTLVASADPNTPDKQPIKITWQSPTAIAPKTLCAQFSATLPSGPTLSFMLEANSGNEDDYVVDTAQFVKCLIKQLSGSVAPPTLLPSTLAFDVSVRPKDADNVRVLSGLAKLPTQLTVTFQYFSSGTPFYSASDDGIVCDCDPKKPAVPPTRGNAAPDQPVPPPPPPAAQSNGPPPSAPQNHQTPALEPIPSEPPGMPQTFRRPMNDGRLTPVAFQQPMQPSGPVGTAASLFAANAGVAADPAPAFTQVVTTGDETAAAAVAKFNALIKSAESELNLALAKPGSPAAATARFAGLTKTAQADLNSALAGLSSPAAMTAKFEAAVKAAEADRKGALASQASPALAAAKFASAVKAAQADLNAGLSGQDSPDAVAAKFAGEAKVAEANLVSALEAHNETVPKSPVIVAPAPVVIAGSNAAPVKKPKSRFHPSRIVGDVRKALGGNATSVLNR